MSGQQLIKEITCTHKERRYEFTLAYVQVSDRSHTEHLLSHRGHMMMLDWHTSLLRTHIETEIKGVEVN